VIEGKTVHKVCMLQLILRYMHSHSSSSGKVVGWCSIVPPLNPIKYMKLLTTMRTVLSCDISVVLSQLA
jgi:hypothetical protein